MHVRASFKLPFPNLAFSSYFAYIFIILIIPTRTTDYNHAEKTVHHYGR